MLAEVAGEHGDFTLMKKCAQRGAALLPELPQWTMIRAYTSWKQHRPEGTLAVLNALLEQHPDYLPALCLAEGQQRGEVGTS